MLMTFKCLIGTYGRKSHPEMLPELVKSALEVIPKGKSRSWVDLMDEDDEAVEGTSTAN